MPPPPPMLHSSIPNHPHLRAWQAPSAFPLLQDEAHLGEELHPIPWFPAEKGQAWDQQTLPKAQGSQHTLPAQDQPPAHMTKGMPWGTA